MPSAVSCLWVCSSPAGGPPWWQWKCSLAAEPKRERPVAAQGGVEVLGDSVEGPVAVVGESVVLGDCYQALGEGSPQELGGNHVVVPVP